MNLETKDKNPWFQTPKAVENPKLRLFCFSYAGGSASTFYEWHKHLPEGIEVCSIQLPGRGTRFKEQAYTSMGPLLADIEQAIAPKVDVPYAFFGHSMGAQLAFELARRLRKSGAPDPKCLFISGRKAPQLKARRKPIHDLPEPEFREQLKQLNGTPQAALDDPELMDLVSPILRADFKTIETWQFEPSEPLEVPLVVMGGNRDKHVSLDDLEEWRAITRGPFSLELFSGDHFFLNQSTDALLHSLNRSLAGLLTRAENWLTKKS